MFIVTDSAKCYENGQRKEHKLNKAWHETEFGKFPRLIDKKYEKQHRIERNGRVAGRERHSRVFDAWLVAGRASKVNVRHEERSILRVTQVRVRIEIGLANVEKIGPQTTHHYFHKVGYYRRHGQAEKVRATVDVQVAQLFRNVDYLIVEHFNFVYEASSIDRMGVVLFSQIDGANYFRADEKHKRHKHAQHDQH